MENKKEIISFVVVGLVLILGFYYGARVEPPKAPALPPPQAVLPAGGVVLPVRWGTLGTELAESGVIDKEKFLTLYAGNPELEREAEKMFTEQNDNLKITGQNAGLLLNFFWALGLGNKNEILETGEMMDPRYGGAQNFASTGGWTIARGNAMEHYSRHTFLSLTTEQQALVDKISRGIYRPCCGNSAHFPDCNHGMAMLGLLELMASQNISEEEMWRAALYVNSYWFPDTYLTIASYMEKKGIPWKKVNPEEVLGIEYSSGQGFQRILREMGPAGNSGGGSCSVQ